MTYKSGDKAFIIESNHIIREVTVTKRSGEFYIVRFSNGMGGIRIRGSRLYDSREVAEAVVPKQPKTTTRTPYDYWH